MNGTTRSASSVIATSGNVGRRGADVTLLGDVQPSGPPHNRGMQNNVREFLGEWTLTLRQREVALLLAQGESYEAISEKLGVSRNTVATHVKAILRKTKLGSSRRLAAYIAQRNASPLG